MQQEKKYYPLGKDIVFKHLFGTTKNIRFTKYLLSKILQKDMSYFDGMEILNSVKLNRQTLRNKQFELDIAIKLKNGELIVLEMQNINSEEAERKNVSYGMKVLIDDMRKNEKYINANPLTEIILINRDSVHSNKKLVNNYQITNRENHDDIMLKDLFRVITINIDVKNDKSYNDDIEFKNFLLSLIEKNKKVVKRQAKKIAIVRDLFKEGCDFMFENYVQSYAYDEWVITKDAEDRGKAMGYAKGALENKKEIARKLLKRNDTIEEIAYLTGLTKKEIKALKKK